MKIPESTRGSLATRLGYHAREKWPAVAGVRVRFRANFASLDGELADGTVIELCRLRYGGERKPYLAHPARGSVERVEVDRDCEDTAGRFGPRVAALDADVVVEMICFTADSARQLVAALRGPERILSIAGLSRVRCGGSSGRCSGGRSLRAPR